MIMKNTKQGEYFFLSNFYPCDITVDINGKSLTFHSVEAAFQAQKNYDLADKFIFLKPLEAKKLGKEIPITTANWNVERLYVMGKALHQKFKSLQLMTKLIAVTEPIVEDNYWGDTFWGRYKNEGKNMLGRMLSNIRENNNDWGSLEYLIKSELIPEL